MSDPNFWLLVSYISLACYAIVLKFEIAARDKEIDTLRWELTHGPFAIRQTGRGEPREANGRG